MKKMIRTMAVMAMAMTMMGAFQLEAKAAYPEKPIHLTIAFKAGGSLDTTFRVYAKALSKALGKPVVVSNRAGAGGAVGASRLKNSKPDGYNLGGNTSLAFALSTNLGKVDYSADDFTYLASIAETQPAFVAVPGKGWKTWQDMIAAAKKKGSLSYASQTPWDKMAIKVINKKSKVNLVAVPTKGGGEMIPALLGGHVDFAWSGGVHYKYVKAGKMVVLAACTSDPLEAFPKVPTLKSLGYDISMDVPFLLAAPKGLPADIKAALEKAAKKAFNDPEVQKLINDKLHMPAVFMNSAQLTAKVKEGYESYKKAMGN